MRCEEIEKLIPDYVSGDISELQRQLLEQHLSRCAPCQETFNVFKEARQHLSSLKDSPVPPDFAKAAMTKVKSATTKGHSQQWLRPALATGAVIIERYEQSLCSDNRAAIIPHVVQLYHQYL